MQEYLILSYLENTQQKLRESVHHCEGEYKECKGLYISRDKKKKKASYPNSLCSDCYSFFAIQLYQVPGLLVRNISLVQLATSMSIVVA